MHCQLRSADRTFFDGDASMVVAQSERGEFAVMDGHAPLLAVLSRGPVRIHTSDATRVFACRRGTLRTSGDLISLLVEAAVPIEEIDLSEVASRMAQLAETKDDSTVDEAEYLSLLREVKERYG